MEPSQHKLKSLGDHHIKISDGRKQNGEEIARPCVATAGDYCKFPLRGAVTGVRDVSCVPCSCPEPGKGRQSAHTNIGAGLWLGFPSMTQPSHQTQCLCCHEMFWHTPAQIPGNVHTRMSESSRCGGGTRQAPLEKNPTHHGGGKPSGCLSTTQHPWPSVILY